MSNPDPHDDRPVLPAQLFRASVDSPPFDPPCSWASTYAEANDWKWNMVFAQGGVGRIWVADIPPNQTFLDAREDRTQLLQLLGEIDETAALHDLVRERYISFRDHGWNWVVFVEPSQVGPEFVYISGPPLAAELTFAPPEDAP